MPEKHEAQQVNFQLTIIPSRTKTPQGSSHPTAYVS